MDNRQGDPIFAKSRAEQLEDWLSNVFWFHYKWYFIAAVFAAALVLMFFFGAATEVKYDWTVVYVNSGAADAERSESLVKLLEKVLPETGKNHRVDVELVETAGSEAGEPVYGYLENQDCVIFLLDGEAKDKYSSLGFFEGAAPVSGAEGIYAAVHDAPVKPLSAEDPQYSNYSQKFLDAVNRENLEEHEKLLSLAKTAISELSK